MSKILIKSLSIAMLGLTLAACGGNSGPETYKLTFGSIATLSSKTQVEISMAAVVYNEKNVIVDMYLDVLQAPFSVTDGTITLDQTQNQTKDAGAKVIETKKELKERYGMSSAKQGEWYIQASNFEKFAIGKTLEEVKAAEEVAGCTISRTGFINTMEAVADTKEFTSDVAPVVGVGTIVSSFSGTTLETTFAGVVTTSDSSVVKEASINMYQVPLKVNEAGDGVELNTSDKACKPENFEGHAASSATKVLSKRELKDLYGMSSAAKGEWYLQADAYAKYCVGKDATTLNSLIGDDGKDANVSTTCTIKVGGLASAVAEGATLKGRAVTETK